MQYRYKGSIIVYNAKHRKYGLHIIHFRRNPTKKLIVYTGRRRELTDVEMKFHNIIGTI